MSSPVKNFIKTHYRHFNAAALLDAAEDYKKLIDSGGKMFLTMGGAMSTAELGISLAEMIRQDKVQAITCTGANLEEDVFNLGINKGYSVLNTIKKFETTLKVKINYKVGSKRKGDIPKLICSNKRLKKYYNSKFTNLRTTIRNHFKFYKILQD